MAKQSSDICNAEKYLRYKHRFPRMEIPQLSGSPVTGFEHFHNKKMCSLCQVQIRAYHFVACYHCLSSFHCVLPEGTVTLSRFRQDPLKSSLFQSEQTWFSQPLLIHCVLQSLTILEDSLGHTPVCPREEK